MTFPATHPALARTLAARDYTVPTAVQLAVIEASAASGDLLVSAQTGSGKTVAFGLAIATTLLGNEEKFGRAAEPLALIIAPTRELALQVQRELVWLYAQTGAHIVTCVGGMDSRGEARELALGAHIVVGTPGRLRDHLERKRLDLSKLKTIVLDEADEMLDLGFREDLEFILDATPESRQTLMFSATMPREIEQLAKRYQREAQRIETVRRDEQHADIEYRAIRVAPGDVEHAVVNVLRFHEMRATLVFCATREAVKRLHARLVERGFSAVALSGELSQQERTHALQALRDGRARVLVATDVAARGLDLPDLTLVIHADLPNDRETLLHRSGRTGRAGRKGLCTLIVPYPKRRKAELLLSQARVRVNWGSAPTAEEIRARDQERFLSDPVFTDVASEEDLGLATALQAARSANEIALALVRIHRAQLPAPEDLATDMGPPPRRDDRPRSPAPWKPSGKHSERIESKPDAPRAGEVPEHSPRPPREDTRPAPALREDRGAPREEIRPMVWFRLNIGRDRNADPKWLLPLICRSGGVSKAEIGAIKIYDRDTRFEILAEFADQFAAAARTNENKEGHISRVGAYSPADDAAVTEAIDRLAPSKPASERPERKPYVSKADTRKPTETYQPKPWQDRNKDKPKDRPAFKDKAGFKAKLGPRPPYKAATGKFAGKSAKPDHKSTAKVKPYPGPSSDKPKFADKKKPRPPAAG